MVYGPPPADEKYRVKMAAIYCCEIVFYFGDKNKDRQEVAVAAIRPVLAAIGRVPSEPSEKMSKNYLTL